MDKASLIRTIVLLIALANQGLSIFGKSPLPISDEDVSQLISFGFTFIVALVTWWKNNYISKRGQAQKKVLQDNDLYKP